LRLELETSALPLLDGSESLARRSDEAGERAIGRYYRNLWIRRSAS
jgi:hypothetical protein